jgi:mycoredoxin
MVAQKIIIYGTDWCGDCFRTRQFLKKHSISFTFLNIDRDKLAEQFVLNTNHGMRSVPTLVFEDGTLLVEPSNQELAEKLGVSV